MHLVNNIIMEKFIFKASTILLFFISIFNFQDNTIVSNLSPIGYSFAPAPCQLPDGSAGAACQALGGNCTVKVDCKSVPVLEP